MRADNGEVWVVAIRPEAWAVGPRAFRLGVGPRRAAAGMRKLLADVPVAAVVDLGVCGGLAEHIRVGDVLLVDGWYGGPRADAALRESLARRLDDAGVIWQGGEALTVSHALTRPWSKHKARRDTGADLCEMEGRAIAEVCAAAGVPMAAVRTVLDDADSILRRASRLPGQLAASLWALRRVVRAIGVEKSQKG